MTHKSHFLQSSFDKRIQCSTGDSVNSTGVDVCESQSTPSVFTDSVTAVVFLQLFFNLYVQTFSTPWPYVHMLYMRALS